jgi:hypothetical protein
VPRSTTEERERFKAHQSLLFKITKKTSIVQEFCYGVYNQCESFIYLDLMVKNREVTIKRYFKWCISTKLV